MKFLDKIKDLFSDDEEVIETKKIKVEENEDHQLPTFMRNKIEEEEKQKEEKKKRDNPVVREEVISDREIVRTRTNSNFSFPIDLDDSDLSDNNIHSGQNVLHKEKKVSDLYSKKEDPKPKKFKPTPVISPVYGILDKNYTKDEVKVQDINSYEIQRPSRKIDFETVRNKAFGNLTDDIKNNLCENCELYQEVKITKNADKRRADDNLLSDMTEEDDISLGTAEENYFDFGVSYEPPKKEQKMDSTTTNIDELEINNNIKIINHNGEEKPAEKIDVREDNLKQITPPSPPLQSNTDASKEARDIPLEELDNDIFNLIDSMYDEEEK